jgi:hypothetical protein
VQKVTASVVEQSATARHLGQPDAAADFSLVLGGPLFQLLRRLQLTGDALQLLRRRVIAGVAVTWLPLLVLSIVEGQAMGGRAAVPFLRDVDVTVRFLVALPLLIVAELVVHQRMRFVVRQFLERGLIPANGHARFHRSIASASRLRNSIIAEITLVAVVYFVGIGLIWHGYTALATTPTWYAAPSPGGMNLTPTGLWYAYISLPILQFLLVRWFFRIGIWARFLWQVSRIELSLIPTHPDRVGGLGFLGNVAYAFLPLAAAHGVMLSGQIANRIFYVGATLPEFKFQIAGMVAFVLCLVLAPFLVFSPQLAAAKRTGLREYGTLAERYVREFDTKWVRGGGPPDEPFIGSADIQSLADLNNSFDVVKTMRLAPIAKESVIPLVVATLAPVVPLALTMMSFEDLVKQLFGALF